MKFRINLKSRLVGCSDFENQYHIFLTSEDSDFRFGS